VQEKILGNTILDNIPNSARKIITIICIIISVPSIVISAIMLYFTPITSLIHAFLFLFIAAGSTELAFIFSPQEWKEWIRELYGREEEENELHTPSPSEDDKKKKEQELRMAYYSGKYPQKEDSKKIISCPPCGQKLNIPPSYNGDVSCPVCKGIISIEKGTILL
jgi:hypothetical protein